MHRLKWIATGCAVAGLCLGGWRLSCWKKEVQAGQKLAFAERLLAGDQPEAALDVLAARPGRSLRDRRWARVEVEALVRTGRGAPLRAIYYRWPELFADSESASLLVARSLLNQRDFDGLAAIRSDWQGHENEPALWLAIDADRLVARGQKAAAVELLEASRVAGPADAVRLERLALLSAAVPESAWRYLDAAVRADPKRKSVRSFRAQMLESAGDPRSALGEYLAAVALDPNDAALRDQLAEFHRRQGDYAAAVATWQGGRSTAATDFALLKAEFFSRVATGPRDDAPLPVCPPGRLEPLVETLRELPTGTWWDDAPLDARLALSGAGAEAARKTIDARQEVFWLRVLDDLARGDDGAALDRLENNPHRAASWAPELERSLRMILGWRLTGRLDPDARLTARTEFPETRHQFLLALDRAHAEARAEHCEGRLPDETRGVVEGREAVTAALLAEGWLEAALVMWNGRQLAVDRPEWLAFGLAQALRFHRGPERAEAFLRDQPASPALDLLRAELRLASGDAAAAEALLGSVAAADSHVGQRAALLLCSAHLERGQADEARAVLAARPRLAATTSGREMSARIALAEDDRATARATYTEIADRSVEARAHLAHAAIAAKEWAVAERHLTELARALPDRPELRLGLRAVREALRGDAP